MIRSYRGLTPRISPSAYVHELAYVNGDVEIGDESSVWPGVVIRGDRARITIGRRTNIQDNTVVHTGGGLPLAIGDAVMVGHCVVLHCVRVGDHVLLGSNSTILDGAEIGEFSIVAAGAVVVPGTKIPARSFVVGTPGRVRGPISAPQHERLLNQGDGYAELAREYAAEGL